MLKVSGLPVDITKSELDELFSPYGVIDPSTFRLDFEEGRRIAYVELANNENAASKGLDGKLFREQYILSVVEGIWGNGIVFPQPGSGGRVGNGS